MRLYFVLLAVLAAPMGCFSHRILVMLPAPNWSHYMQVEPLFLALAARGHNVTAVSPFPPKEETPNFKHVFLAADEQKTVNTFADKNWMKTSKNHHSTFLTNIFKYVSMPVYTNILDSAVFQDLIRGGSKFDLIFTELFFGQEALVVLGRIFNAPVVTYNSWGYTAQILRLVGAANSFSYIPSKVLGHAGPMSYLQRLMNGWERFKAITYDEYWYFPSQDALISKYIPGPQPSISDMLQNVSLFFLTANIAVDDAKLYPPNVVEISGLHLKELTPLDEELKTIMDEAKNGVIYFAFGSTLSMSDLQKEDIQTFLFVFKQLNQTVLWKTNLNVSNLEIPENVYTREWFNQVGVLDHPNCALFVTHGGLSSVMEAIRYSVPMVLMPIFADQFSNAVNAEYHGYGLQVRYTELTRDTLYYAIKTVLGNSRFQENIYKASRIFTDKETSSLDTSVYWMEYVIRHEGAHHLKPLAAQIPSYQLFLLDIIATVVLPFVVLLYLTVKIVLLIFRKVCRKSKP